MPPALRMMGCRAFSILAKAAGGGAGWFCRAGLAPLCGVLRVGVCTGVPRGCRPPIIALWRL